MAEKTDKHNTVRLIRALEIALGCGEKSKNDVNFEFFLVALTRNREKLYEIINDRVDVALAVGADGVHVGQSDLPAREVRRLIGPDMLLGVSCATVEEAMAAQADGADYLGVGAMFATDTKTDTRPVSTETLCAIRAAVDIPIVIIGGINPKTAPLFYGTGISGLAVVSAIVAQPDIAAAARQLKEMSKEL